MNVLKQSSILKNEPSRGHNLTVFTTVSDYKVFDDHGEQVGTFQYNSRFSKRETKRQADPPAVDPVVAESPAASSGPSSIVQEDNHDYYSSVVSHSTPDLLFS